MPDRAGQGTYPNMAEEDKGELMPKKAKAGKKNGRRRLPWDTQAAILQTAIQVVSDEHPQRGISISRVETVYRLLEAEVARNGRPISADNS